MQLTRATQDAKTECDLLRFQVAWLTGMLKRVSSTQYATKDLLEQNANDLKAADAAIGRFVDTVLEELEV